MEKFKSLVEVGGMSKIIKLLTLVIGMGASGNVFSQEKVSNLEQLIQDAKKYELAISEKAKEKGQLGNINHNSLARISDKTRISEIIYTDNQRKNIANVLVGSENFFFSDFNGDGEIDAVYIDKDKKLKEIEEASMNARISMEGKITRVELEMSDMMGEFVCFKLGNINEVYDSSDDTVSSISKKEDQNMVKTKLQEKFNKTLKDNLENIK